MVVFAPWAFGTTEPWSIRTMNAAGCLLGGLLFAKRLIRWRTGYTPARWNGERGGRDAERRNFARRATTALAALTVVMLAYCLVSAINARSTYYYTQDAFEPHDYIDWLPHSYDDRASWQSFWMLLGLALTFWGARDWLLGKTARERHESNGDSTARGARGALPDRLRRLLWVLCLNGALLALEGTLQRLSGTGKLLWLIQPYFNTDFVSQFGPYAYRANAAQYFNLLWPVCLGFWWTLRRDARNAPVAGARVGGSPHVLLLPCAVLLAAAPIISTSRGGAIVAVAELLVACALLMIAPRRGHWWLRLGVLLLFAITLGLAGYLGWEKLEPRLKTIFSDDLSGRVVLYRNARQIARDFPVYGTGPGTFPWIYSLYRANQDEERAGYAHNDWLETRITFGWVGFTLILVMLLLVPARWCAGGDGIRCPWLLVAMIGLSLGGCLVHARFDFPLQIYSTLALFLLLCAVLFCFSRPRGPVNSPARPPPA
jgi:TRAP-type C4-dicarboxylate transport system permease small subunit